MGQTSPLGQEHWVLPIKKENNQNLKFGLIIQAAVPMHFKVDCSKKINIPLPCLGTPPIAY